MKKPKISCVMPCRNRQSIIGETIQSIIDQTFSDWELIIIDDHSDPDDDTEKVVKKFNDPRIKFFGSMISLEKLSLQQEILVTCWQQENTLPCKIRMIFHMIIVFSQLLKHLRSLGQMSCMEVWIFGIPKLVR